MVVLVVIYLFIYFVLCWLHGEETRCSAMEPRVTYIDGLQTPHIQPKQYLQEQQQDPTGLSSKVLLGATQSSSETQTKEDILKDKNRM